MCPDIFGSIGGFIFGVLIGISMLPIKTENNVPARKERILFWFTVITSVGLYVLFIVLFFTVKKPQLFWYYSSKQ
jgi:hypothetical protein